MRKLLLAILLILTLLGCTPAEPQGNPITPVPVIREEVPVQVEKNEILPTQAVQTPPAETTQTPVKKAESEETAVCTISISCEKLVQNLDLCDPEKVELIPSDGWILKPTTVELISGESVFDQLLRVCREQGILMEYSDTPMYDSAYIEGIANLYEFDGGPLSGWMYSVNGTFPNYGSSHYLLEENDMVCWQYTCDLGADIGGAQR